MMHSAVSLPEADRRKQRSQYQECLSELATSFCHVLQRMYKAEAAARIIYQCSGRKHHPIPLRKRNIDCLAVILVNLAAATPLPAEFGRTWKIGKEVGFAIIIICFIFDLTQSRFSTPMMSADNIPQVAPQSSLGESSACQYQITMAKKVYYLL